MSEAATILLVDDEPDLLEIFAIELEFAGYNIKPAGNGTEAFEKLKEGGIHAILSDIRMANGDGIELLEKVRELNYCEPPMLFMTGFADINEEEAFDKGAAGFFHKPIDGSSLIQGIKKVLIPKTEAWKTLPTNIEQATKLEIKLEDFDQAKKTNKIKFGHGGFFIQLDDFSNKIGSLIQFNLNFNDKSHFKGYGEVRWNRKPNSKNSQSGAGLEILFLDEASLRFYNSFISTETPIPFIPN